MKKSVILVGALLLVVAVADHLYAYTYTFRNRTVFPITLIVELYEGEDRTGRVEPQGSYTVSTPLLLKSWRVEALVDNQWQQVMHNTCDLLPGSYAFSVNVEETKDPAGRVMRTWYSSNQ